MALIPGLGRSPEGERGNQHQYSCLENPMHRGAWWATVHCVAELVMTEATQHACTYYKTVWLVQPSFLSL